MVYTKQNWVTGDVITAEKMNHIEDGIAGAGSGSGSDDVFEINFDDGPVADKTYIDIYTAFSVYAESDVTRTKPLPAKGVDNYHGVTFNEGKIVMGDYGYYVITHDQSYVKIQDPGKGLYFERTIRGYIINVNDDVSTFEATFTNDATTDYIIDSGI